MLRWLAWMALMAVMLAWQAPAWLVTSRIVEASDGWIDLRNSSGTIWSGSADAVATTTSSAAVSNGARTGKGAGSGTIALGRIAWRFVRVDGSRRAFSVDIEQTPPATRSARLTAGFAHRVLSGGVRIPAAIVTRLPQLAGWSIGGTIGIESDAFELSGGSAGTATFAWRNASISPADFPESFALGDVSGRIAFDPKGAALTFANSGGSVQVAGSGDARTGQVTLQLQPRANATPTQVAWMQSHLTPQAPGSYAIGFSIPRN